MKILVTGAGGFIGSHLAEVCVERGFTVKALVHYNARGTWGWLEESPSRDQIEVVAGDIRDFDSVHAAMKQCEMVLHLAALIGIPYSYESPLAYVKTNIEGTYNVLEAAKTLGVGLVVVTSTSETYGTAQYVPIDERHPHVGQSPYAATKIAADQLAISYFRSFHLPIKIARPFNTYGPRQSARAIVPSVVTQILSGAKKVHVGNVHPTRDLTFVKDTAEGILALARCDGGFGEAVNIGMNTEIGIGDLVAKIAGLMGFAGGIETDTERVRPESSEVDRLRCDNSKIRKIAGWEPHHDLDNGLRETIAWLRTHHHMFKPERYTR